MQSGKIREKTVYLIISLWQDQADSQRLLNLIRGHWAIEKIKVTMSEIS
jgi:hypothetical protein